MNKRDLEIKLSNEEMFRRNAEHRTEIAEAAYATAIRDKKAVQARLRAAREIPQERPEWLRIEERARVIIWMLIWFTVALFWAAVAWAVFG